ncbi:hypothetical protein NE237_015929 [Protea cynaroides]|uniref:Alanyl-transfer RNA synthetases family profile domain-containing protein n=1 Tax=Protea cynaroides TaxID=273540 RepID=A0A9Q0KEN7_9MAGN|nr:hypothetical protein NE237_015929 [Protea cynaroides]
MDSIEATKLTYFDDMWKLHSKTLLISCSQGEDGRCALILDSTIFHPQGGGQPSDTGFVTHGASDLKFIVQDARLKDGLVFHYGFFEKSGNDEDPELRKGQEVCLYVDEPRRNLNSRLHSAGHLLDICMGKVGWGHLKPGKAYHFPDGPFVEYKGAVPQNEIQSKQKELEMEASALISRGGKVSAAVLSYEEASELCGGSLPDYIPKESTPRIVKLGEYPGCPCGGTHVVDISEIRSLKVGQIRTKKGMTKDAAEFLAGTFYETFGFYLSFLDLKPKQGTVTSSDGSLRDLTSLTVFWKLIDNSSWNMPDAALIVVDMIYFRTYSIRPGMNESPFHHQFRVHLQEVSVQKN